MKLFKSLLVAPATLGLLAPMTATANEVTISDFTPAEQLAITKITTNQQRQLCHFKTISLKLLDPYNISIVLQT